MVLRSTAHGRHGEIARAHSCRPCSRRYSSPELDAPPYGFFRLPFLGGPAERRLVFPAFGLPRALPARPESPAEGRLFRPALPPFMMRLSRVHQGADGSVASRSLEHPERQLHL